MRIRISLATIFVTATSGTAMAQDTQLYWGDTHLHTNYSPDAYSLLTETADPDSSYRFAKGLPVIADLSRSRVQIRTPLDFLVVTDHAEYMGVIPEIAAGNEELMKVDGGERFWQFGRNEVGHGAVYCCKGRAIIAASSPADIAEMLRIGVFVQPPAGGFHLCSGPAYTPRKSRGTIGWSPLRSRHETGTKSRLLSTAYLLTLNARRTLLATSPSSFCSDGWT